MPNKIHEIELNVSNVCGANCIMCSEPHGCDNIETMEPRVFNELLRQLKDVDFDIIQTSGDGETFKNINYIEFIRALKMNFPSIPRWIYNNFSIWDKQKANTIVEENLLSKVHTRIDSLNPEIFKLSSGLDIEPVLENIKYFCSINDKIPFTILYNNIADYYNRVKCVTGKRPIRDRLTDEQLSKVQNEQQLIYNEIVKYCKEPRLLGMARINHGLWGERYRDDIVHNPLHPCPKIRVIENVCWIYPNGNIGMCCYEDRQSPEFSLGNIMENHILDIFYSEKRLEIINKLNNLEKENPFSNYPCINPRLCGFGDCSESKDIKREIK